MPIAALRYGFFPAVALFYAVALLLWWPMQWLPAPQPGLLQMSHVFGSWFYVPLLPLLLWALVRQRPWAAAILLVPALLFLVDYGRLYLPRLDLMSSARASASVQSEVHTLRVVNWNAFFANQQVEPLLELIEREQPDVIAIQELGTGFARRLDGALGERYPHRALYPGGTPSGIGLYSNWPLLESSPVEYRRGAPACNCHWVRIDWREQRVTIINTHPWPPRVRLGRYARPGAPLFSTEGQTRTFDRLLELVQAARATGEPLLLVGDLNTSDRQSNYKRLRPYLSDAHREAGWGMGYTFPDAGHVGRLPLRPLIRIDYVLHGPQWRAERLHTLSLPGSDHRLLVADLTLK